MKTFKTLIGPIHYFESLNDVIHTIDETVKTRGMESMWLKKLSKGPHMDRSSVEWAGGTYEDLRQDIIYGNKDLVIETDKKVGELLNKNYLEDQFYMDLEGFSYDMGALNSGEPEYCLNRAEEKAKKVIDILIDPSYNGNNGPEVLSARGAAIVKFAASLKENNYIVNSYIFETTNARYSTNHGGNRSYELIKLDDEFNIINQIAIASNTKFFRTGLIAVSGICNGEFNEPGWAYGDWESSSDMSWTKELEKGAPILSKSPFIIGGGYNWPEMNYLDNVAECYKIILKRFEAYQKELTNET